MNRVIRLRDAPIYLGMNINRFNQEVRPTIPEFRIGDRGIAFDRLDLDAWFENYKSCSERLKEIGAKKWDAKRYQGSLNDMDSGRSTRRSVDDAYAKALGLTT